MEATLAPVALTSSEVLRYAAAFFFVLVALAIAYALIKAAKTLERVDKVLADVDGEAVPLMKKAGVTLDGVNANLNNVDDITKDVAHITDRIDGMANVIEGAVSKPARKAAAFSAGVQTAVSSFMRRDKADAPEESAEEASPWAGAAASAEAPAEPVVASAPEAAPGTPAGPEFVTPAMSGELAEETTLSWPVSAASAEGAAPPAPGSGAR
jgi:uncharacterized protein YoxC